MNNELLLLIKKHTDTLIEQTKTKTQETLEFKMNKQLQNKITYSYMYKNNSDLNTCNFTILIL